MSANASKGKLRLIQGGLAEQRPPAFDPDVTRALMNRAIAGSPGAVIELVQQTGMLLTVLGVMGSEIASFRQTVKALAQQSTDQATINSVLLAVAGGEVRVPSDWFEAFEIKGGFSVDETDTEVIIRALIDQPGPQGVPLASASQQTED
jgi:hypothetical protein